MTDTGMKEAKEQGRFEGEVLSELRAIRCDLAGYATRQEDHETRMRALEAEKSRLRGATAVISGLVAFAATAVIDVVMSAFGKK